MKAPATLDEAIDQMVASMTEDDKVRYREEPEAYPGARFHFTSGMAMRNDWGLWHGRTGISKWLRAKRIYHGDDQSAVIYKALWRRLHGLSLDDAWLAKEAAYYEAFWAKSGLTWDQKPISGFEPKARRLFRFDKDGTIEDIDP